MRDQGSLFARYLGIDYSGAQTPTSSLPGLRVYEAQADSAAAPVERPPPPSPRKYWTRRGLAEWLAGVLADGPPTLVGIDHAFSFPEAYFRRHGLAHDWPAFLDDFQRFWPTDGDFVYVDFVRDGSVGCGAARLGERRWRRLSERRSGSAKSVFHFDVQGSVAKSTHAGLPWLRFLRRALGERVHFWPFDGWEAPAGRSLIAEVYPRLCRRRYPPEDRSGDQHDACSVAAWLRDADREGELERRLSPPLTDSERATAAIEGWILGVVCDSEGLCDGFLRTRREGALTVLEVATTRWSGPHTPELRWRVHRTWASPPSARQLAAAREAALSDPRCFRTCECCGVRQDAGSLHDPRTCMGCAARFFGVVY